MIDITENKPLVFIKLADGERILVPWSTDKLKQKLSFDFLETDEGRIIPTAKNVIVDSGRASAYDYFMFYGQKTVHPHILSVFLGRLANKTEKEKQKLTNLQIWGMIQKIREEEVYYTATYQPISRERFTEIDKQIRERLGWNK